MVENQSILVGILVGTAVDTDKARKIGAFLESCPYCALSTSKDDTVFAVLTIPHEHKWWLESIKEQPENTVGLENADVFYATAVKAPSPWSAGKVEPTMDKSPCGAECQGCRVYKKACRGCPATVHYVEEVR
jgi:hypothetical protein